MLFVARGMKIALQADDGFSKLLAAGLTFGFALQTFIIVGGVLRMIPLTGITLPFVSYGGSSVVANFVAARGPAPRLRPGERNHMNKQISRVALVALLLLASLIVATTYWQVVGGAGPRGAPGQRDPARRAVQDQARPDLRVRRQDRARDEPDQEGRRPDALLPPLSDERACVAGRRLLDAGPLARRHRAPGERVPDRREREPRDDLGQAHRQAEGDDRHAATTSSLNIHVERAEDRRDRTARQVRRGCRPEPEDRRRLRDGVVAGLQPEPDRVAERLRGRSSTRRARAPARRRRCSTARPRASTRRARRSRPSPRPPRSTPGSTRRTRSSSIRATASSTDRQVSNAGDPDRRRSGSATSTSSQAFQHSINAVFCDIGKASARAPSSTRRRTSASTRRRRSSCRRTRSRASGLYDFKKQRAVRQRRPGRPGPPRVRAGARCS